jgi:hypothetical protein
MFSRNNKLDYQLFFHTKGAFRRLGWNGLIIVVCLSNIMNYRIGIDHTGMKVPSALRVMLYVIDIMVPPVLGMFHSLGALKVLPRSTLMYSPLVAILLMVPSIAVFTTKNTTIKWIVFTLLFLPVFLITIISSRLPFPIIRRLLDSSLGTKKIFRRQRIMRLCMFAALAMSVFMSDCWMVVVLYDLYALVVVSFGNLQIPAAVARIAIALMRLVNHNYYGEDANDSGKSKTNIAPSLNIFYGMVLGQGILYVMACLLENFVSFIPKKSLARRSGLTSRCGRNFISLYYSHALEKSMEGDVLAPKKISLNNYAINCLDSEKPEMQLHGIQVMHSLLLREETRKQLFTKLTSSTKVMARVIEMLGWSSPQDRNIRFFAAKVICELATSLRVATIPGTIQVVSALLDYGNQQERANPLLNIEVEHEKIPHPIQNIDDNHEERLIVGQDTGNLLVETQEHSTQQVCTSSEQQKPEKLRCWQHIFGCWSIPQKEPKPLTEKDPLPALGMSILDGLVCCDQDNCLEISKTSALVPKIVRFTGYGRSSDTMYTHSQRKVLMMSSLKLLHSLVCIHGEVGITLRHKVSKNPFLLRNLAAVLGDIMSSHELKRLVAGILRNLAIDRDARQGIGRNQVIISRLMHAFLTPGGSSSTDIESGLLFQKAAGQALAMLAMDNVNNTLGMLREAEYEFIKELTIMIYVDRYRCVAASLLQSMCRHARLGLKEPDLKELSYSLREVSSSKSKLPVQCNLLMSYYMCS